jgi:cytochrome b pre-mRNA-processing protein 3
LSFLATLFGERDQRARLRPLYEAAVARARDPQWYRGGVPDTLDGRFDMLAALMSLLLIRLEREGAAARAESVLLTETFIEDMDATLRQIGIGDFVVGKHVGKMMGALGGRLGAFREGLAAGDLQAAVRRNVFRDAPPSDEAVAFVAERLAQFAAGLDKCGLTEILEGKIETR